MPLSLFLEWTDRIIREVLTNAGDDGKPLLAEYEQTTRVSD